MNRAFFRRASFVWLAVLMMASLGSGGSRADDGGGLTLSSLRPVWRLGALGALAGAGTGLVVWPISKRFNSVVVGCGVGAVLGAAVGVYDVVYRDDPENPLAGIGVSLPGSETPLSLTYQVRF